MSASGNTRLFGESNPATRLTWDQVLEMRRVAEGGNRNCKDLGRRFGVSESCARDIIKGRRWPVSGRDRPEVGARRYTEHVADHGEGVVYGIQAATGGPVKIGWSTSPRHAFRRLASLQTGNPELLQLRWAIAGSQDVERMAHRVFAAQRVRGEWFTVTSAIEEFFRSRYMDSERFMKEQRRYDSLQAAAERAFAGRVAPTEERLAYIACELRAGRWNRRSLVAKACDWGLSSQRVRELQYEARRMVARQTADPLRRAPARTRARSNEQATDSTQQDLFGHAREEGAA